MKTAISWRPFRELPGCHTQAKSLDELNERIKEAIALYLERRKQAEIVELFGTIPYAADYDPKLRAR